MRRDRRAETIVRILKGFAGALFAAILISILPPAEAQSYPARPIRLISPYPPGGGVDTVSRLLSELLSPRLGQTLVVDNRPGAGATIGAQLLAKSAPDGYTLMVGSMVDYSIAPYFHPNLAFDMRRDFVPIVEIGYGTIGMVVTPGLAANSVKEVIALAKAKPGQLVYASSGHGGLIHLNLEMFKQMAGVDLVHAAYKGTTLFQPDLYSGRVHLSIDNVLAHLPHIKAGRVRALAVASRERSPLLPDVPTMIEAGLKGFLSATNYTLFAPAGTAKSVVAKLNAESNTVIRQAEFRDRLLGLGIVVTGGTQEAVQARVSEEMARWAAVIKAANIRPQ